MLRAQARQGRGPGGADRRRSAHRRDPRVRRRPLVQPVAVQPRRHAAAAAGLGLQAVRLPRGVRAGGRRRAGPTSRRPRSSTTSRRRSTFDDQVWTPENYEDEYDGADHAAPRARACRATSRTIKVARADRLRPASRRCGSSSASAHAAEAVSVDRARAFRGDAVRRSPTAYTLFPNGGAIAAAAHDHADHQRRQRRHAEAPTRRSRASPGRTRRSSSPT